MAEYLDGMAAFYKRCLAAYDARNHEGTSGRKTACDTHRTYAIADLAARCAVRAAWLREREREREKDHKWITQHKRTNHEDVFCARPRPAPFARALTATERGQLPSHVDVEMLRGPNYGKGGKKVWPQPFADWASRWSKRGAGDAPAIVETNVGSATATAAARAAVAELLRAVAAHPSRLRVSGRAHTCARASPPRLARVRVVSALRTAPSCARRLASSPRVIVSRHQLFDKSHSHRFLN
jgi:hypothetical protein